MGVDAAGGEVGERAKDRLDAFFRGHEAERDEDDARRRGSRARGESARALGRRSGRRQAGGTPMRMRVDADVGIPVAQVAGDEVVVDGDQPGRATTAGIIGQR